MVDRNVGIGIMHAAWQLRNIIVRDQAMQLESLVVREHASQELWYLGAWYLGTLEVRGYTDSWGTCQLAQFEKV